MSIGNDPNIARSPAGDAYIGRIICTSLLPVEEGSQPQTTAEHDDASGNRALADAHTAGASPKPPSATSGGHLDAPSPVDHTARAERELVSFATVRRLPVSGAPGEPSVVWLRAELDGCGLTFWIGPQGPMFFVKHPTRGNITVGHHTAEDAVKGAISLAQIVTPAQAAPTTSRPTVRPVARPRVYVCHPYSADPAGNAVKVAAICKRLVVEGITPIAPQVYLAAFVDDAAERDLAMVLRMDLMRWCDEVRVYGPTLSPGMLEELRFAMARGMTITHHSAD